MTGAQWPAKCARPRSAAAVFLVTPHLSLVNKSLEELRLQEERAKAAMTGGGGGAQDLASIQKVVDGLPELNRRKREVAKHVAICSDLSKSATMLFALSEVQQELLMTVAQPSMPLPESLYHQGDSPLSQA